MNEEEEKKGSISDTSSIYTVGSSKFNRPNEIFKLKYVDSTKKKG